MVWFSEDLVRPEDLSQRFLTRLRHVRLDDSDDVSSATSAASGMAASTPLVARWPYSLATEIGPVHA